MCVLSELLLPGRAVVLGALGQHRQALQLYVTALHDLTAALRYCHRYYSATGPASQVSTSGTHYSPLNA